MRSWADSNCKVLLSLADNRKHVQVVHHARARLLFIILFIVHYFSSFIIRDFDSFSLPLYHFIYYKNFTYTTFLVVELIPHSVVFPLLVVSHRHV